MQSSLVKEGFAERADHANPLDIDESTARTASCKNAAGDFLLFSSLSQLWRCGSTVSEMSNMMLRNGCVEGMLHDGGASAAFYAHVEGRTMRRTLPLINRKVPVWLAVVAP